MNQQNQECDRRPKPGSYRVGDAAEYLRTTLRHRIQVGAVITSPPYNLGLRSRNSKNTNWRYNALAEEGGYAATRDDLSRDEYIRQQTRIIGLALELVGERGLVAYVHKPVHRNKKLISQWDIIAPWQEQLRDKIIWDRGDTNNHDPTFLPPTYEEVWLLAGPGWKRETEAYRQSKNWGSVWRIRPRANPEHPAPFPEELARRLILLGNGAPVCDPYAGSGTVGFAARKMGVDYYLNDISPEYARNFRDKIRNLERQPELPGLP